MNTAARRVRLNSPHSVPPTHGYAVTAANESPHVGTQSALQA